MTYFVENCNVYCITFVQNYNYVKKEQLELLLRWGEGRDEGAKK
jgi:hypothetical protein